MRRGWARMPDDGRNGDYITRHDGGQQVKSPGPRFENVRFGSLGNRTATRRVGRTIQRDRARPRSIPIGALDGEDPCRLARRGDTATVSSWSKDDVVLLSRVSRLEQTPPHGVARRQLGPIPSLGKWNVGAPAGLRQANVGNSVLGRDSRDCRSTSSLTVTAAFIASFVACGSSPLATWPRKSRAFLRA
jgi:hypothetical protein